VVGELKRFDGAANELKDLLSVTEVAGIPSSAVSVTWCSQLRCTQTFNLAIRLSAQDAECQRREALELLRSALDTQAAIPDPTYRLMLDVSYLP
jgi:hypothetical protein